MKVKVYSTSKHPLPQYATKQSAGLDLRANIDAPITINPRERVLVPTGFTYNFQKVLKQEFSLEVDWLLKKESLVLILLDAWMPTIEVM